VKASNLTYNTYIYTRDSYKENKLVQEGIPIWDTYDKRQGFHHTGDKWENYFSELLNMHIQFNQLEMYFIEPPVLKRSFNEVESGSVEN
jgi:hypothetical protein